MKTPEIYRQGDINLNPEDNSYYLEVTLANSLIQLPIINVGNEEEVWIAWFDPRKQELANAGAIEIGEILAFINPSLAITPQSKKSVEMIQKAVNSTETQTGQDLPLLVLPGGFNQREVSITVGSEGFIISYHPVTSPNEPKYLGISKYQAALIQTALLEKNGVVLIDDIYSTGETIKATKQLLHMNLGDVSEIEDIPIVVVARETVMRDETPEEIPNLYSAITMPVVIGTLSSSP